MKPNASFVSSSQAQSAVVTLFVMMVGVILFVLLLERFLPDISNSILPVLIAVFAGSILAPRLDRYLKKRFSKKRFPKAVTMGEVIPPAIVSRLFVVSLIGLHVIAIGLILLVYKSL